MKHILIICIIFCAYTMHQQKQTIKALVHDLNRVVYEFHNEIDMLKESKCN